MNSDAKTRLGQVTALVTAGILALGLAACDQQQKKPEKSSQLESVPQNSPDTGAPQQRAAVDIPDPGGDTVLASRVKTAISAEPALKSITVDVVAIDGVVTLNGTADTPVSSDRAAKIALNVDGVRSVKNELIVVQGS